MSRTGAQLVVRALEDEGIPFTFGIPGTHNIELYDELSKSEKVRAVLVTDEQSASFMADGVWRASGRMACANVVPGAGLTHALSGIAEAFMDNVPMLVLGCGIRRDTGKAYQLHDVDQLAIARPITKGTFRPTRGSEIYSTIRKACALARSGAPGPVMVEIPADQYLFKHDGDLVAPEAASPAGTTALMVERAAALLAKSRRPLFYVGLGAARAEVVALAERLEAPVATTIQGKGVFPESHPLWLWPGFGKGAPAFARDVAAGCDATLAIGCKFGEVATASYGAEPPKPLIHVDIDPSVLGKNHRPELGVVSDARLFVEALLSRLPARGADAALRERIREGHRALREESERSRSTTGVTPALLLESLQRTFGPETIFTSDSGNGTFLAMETLRLERPGRLLSPVDYSCMGYAVPAAIGAKAARPEAPVVALAGDGAFQMTGLELLTSVSEGFPIVVVLLRDGELAQIAQFQSTAMNRKTCTVLPDLDLEAFCRAVGVEHVPLERDEGISAALSRASAASKEGRTVVVDARVDYSQKTWFTRGVVSVNLGRLPLKDRLRFIGRAVVRLVTG